MQKTLGHYNLANRVLYVLLNTIANIGFASIAFKQSLYTTVFLGILVTVKGVSRKARHLAGFGDIAQLLGQIQQSDLVFDCTLIHRTHGVTPLAITSRFDEDSHLHQNGELHPLARYLSDQVGTIASDMITCKYREPSKTTKIDFYGGMASESNLLLN